MVYLQRSDRISVACGPCACSRSAGTFQMFDDAPSHHRVPPQYDVRNITTVPVALFMGLRDTIIDPPRLVSMLPPTTAVHYLKSYGRAGSACSPCATHGS